MKHTLTLPWLWLRYDLGWRIRERITVLAVRFVRSRMTFYRREDVYLHVQLKAWQAKRDPHAEAAAGLPNDEGQPTRRTNAQ